MMVKPELPKGGGLCFICKKKCEELWYWHPECRVKYIEDARRSE